MHHNTVSSKFILIVVFLTNISQLPFLLNTNLNQYFAYPVWTSLVIVMLFIDKNVKVSIFDFKIIMLLLIFGIGVIAGEIFTSYSHVNSPKLYMLYTSLGILMIGKQLSKSLFYDDIKNIMYAYVLSGIILTVVIYIDFFAKNYNWLSAGYVYGPKNSISQIILTTMIFAYYMIVPKKRIVKLLKMIILIFLLIVIFALKSRATILGIIIIPLVLIVFRSTNKKTRNILLIYYIIIGTIILVIPRLNEIFIDGVLFAGRRSNSLDDISSGRVTHMLVNFPKYIKGNEILGVGDALYVENFYLDSILKHGLIFGGFLICIALWPLGWALRNIKTKSNLSEVFLLLSIIYLLNGIFEAHAPFGPGVKNYMLWFLFGILYNGRKYPYLLSSVQAYSQM